VTVVGERRGDRKNAVGAGSLEEGLIVLWRRWFSAPLEYATPAAISISAATVSLREWRFPRLRRLPLLLGMEGAGAGAWLVGRVLP